MRQNVVKTTEEGLKRSSERQLRRKVKTLFWPPLFFATAALRCDLTPPPFAFFLSSTTLTLRPSAATTIATTTKGTTIVNMSFALQTMVKNNSFSDQYYRLLTTLKYLIIVRIFTIFPQPNQRELFHRKCRAFKLIQKACS